MMNEDKTNTLPELKTVLSEMATFLDALTQDSTILTFDEFLIFVIRLNAYETVSHSENIEILYFIQDILNTFKFNKISIKEEENINELCDLIDKSLTLLIHNTPFLDVENCFVSHDRLKNLADFMDNVKYVPARLHLYFDSVIIKLNDKLLPAASTYTAFVFCWAHCFSHLVSHFYNNKKLDAPQHDLIVHQITKTLTLMNRDKDKIKSYSQGQLLVVKYLFVYVDFIIYHLKIDAEKARTLLMDSLNTQNGLFDEFLEALFPETVDKLLPIKFNFRKNISYFTNTISTLNNNDQISNLAREINSFAKEDMYNIFKLGGLFNFHFLLIHLTLKKIVLAKLDKKLMLTVLNQSILQYSSFDIDNSLQKRAIQLQNMITSKKDEMVLHFYLPKNIYNRKLQQFKTSQPEEYEMVEYVNDIITSNYCKGSIAGNKIDVPNEDGTGIALTLYNCTLEATGDIRFSIIMNLDDGEQDTLSMLHFYAACFKEQVTCEENYFDPFYTWYFEQNFDQFTSKFMPLAYNLDTAHPPQIDRSYVNPIVDFFHIISLNIPSIKSIDLFNKIVKLGNNYLAVLPEDVQAQILRLSSTTPLTKEELIDTINELYRFIICENNFKINGRTVSTTRTMHEDVYVKIKDVISGIVNIHIPHLFTTRNKIILPASYIPILFHLKVNLIDQFKTDSKFFKDICAKVSSFDIESRAVCPNSIPEHRSPKLAQIILQEDSYPDLTDNINSMIDFLLHKEKDEKITNLCFKIKVLTNTLNKIIQKPGYSELLTEHYLGIINDRFIKIKHILLTYYSGNVTNTLNTALFTLFDEFTTKKERTIKPKATGAKIYTLEELDFDDTKNQKNKNSNHNKNQKKKKKNNQITHQKHKEIALTASTTLPTLIPLAERHSVPEVCLNLGMNPYSSLDISEPLVIGQPVPSTPPLFTSKIQNKTPRPSVEEEIVEAPDTDVSTASSPIQELETGPTNDSTLEDPDVGPVQATRELIVFEFDDGTNSALESPIESHTEYSPDSLINYHNLTDTTASLELEEQSKTEIEPEDELYVPNELELNELLDSEVEDLPTSCLSSRSEISLAFNDVDRLYRTPSRRESSENDLMSTPKTSSKSVFEVFTDAGSSLYCLRTNLSAPLPCAPSTPTIPSEPLSWNTDYDSNIFDHEKFPAIANNSLYKMEELILEPMVKPINESTKGKEKSLLNLNPIYFPSNRNVGFSPRLAPIGITPRPDKLQATVQTPTLISMPPSREVKLKPIALINPMKAALDCFNQARNILEFNPSDLSTAHICFMDCIENFSKVDNDSHLDVRLMCYYNVAIFHLNQILKINLPGQNLHPYDPDVDRLSVCIHQAARMSLSAILTKKKVIQSNFDSVSTLLLKDLVMTLSNHIKELMQVMTLNTALRDMSLANLYFSQLLESTPKKEMAFSLLENAICFNKPIQDQECSSRLQSYLIFKKNFHQNQIAFNSTMEGRCQQLLLELPMSRKTSPFNQTRPDNMHIRRFTPSPTYPKQKKLGPN